MERFVSARIIFTFEFNIYAHLLPHSEIYIQQQRTEARNNNKKKLIFQTNSLTFLLKENATAELKKKVSPMQKQKKYIARDRFFPLYYIVLCKRVYKLNKLPLGKCEKK